MSSENYNVQVSISMPPVAQFAKGDMVNIRGESAVEVKALLEEALEADLFETAALASKTYLAAAGLTEAPQAGSAPDKGSPKQDQSDNVVGQGRFCDHGKRKYISGSGRKGPWAGWFCPLEKGDPNQCEPVWAD